MVIQCFFRYILCTPKYGDVQKVHNIYISYIRVFKFFSPICTENISLIRQQSSVQKGLNRHNIPAHPVSSSFRGRLFPSGKLLQSYPNLQASARNKFVRR